VLREEIEAIKAAVIETAWLVLFLLIVVCLGVFGVLHWVRS